MLPRIDLKKGRFLSMKKVNKLFGKKITIECKSAMILDSRFTWSKVYDEYEHIPIGKEKTREFLVSIEGGKPVWLPQCEVFYLED